MSEREKQEHFIPKIESERPERLRTPEKEKTGIWYRVSTKSGRQIGSGAIAEGRYATPHLDAAARLAFYSARRASGLWGEEGPAYWSGVLEVWSGRAREPKLHEGDQLHDPNTDRDEMILLQDAELKQTIEMYADSEEGLRDVIDRFRAALETFKPIKDSAGWTFEAKEVSNKRLVIVQTLSSRQEEELIKEIGVYDQISFDGIDGSFYIQKKNESGSGTLPHGDAVYLREWDVILLNSYTFSEMKLNKKTFTILAHEIGHRESDRKVVEIGREGDSRLAYERKELLAWMTCLEKFQNHPMIDIGYVQREIQSCRSYIVELESDKKNPSGSPV